MCDAVKNLFRIFSLHAAQNCGYFSNILMFHKLLRKIADIFADNYTIIFFMINKEKENDNNNTLTM